MPDILLYAFRVIERLGHENKFDKIKKILSVRWRIAEIAARNEGASFLDRGFNSDLKLEKPKVFAEARLHPLAMFPGFFVPLFLAFHLVSVGKLRQHGAALAVAGGRLG